MGLDEFVSDRGEDQDTYYYYKMVGLVDVEILGENQASNLPYPVRAMFSSSELEIREAPITTTIEFNVEGRGWTKQEAWEAAHSKIEQLEDNELDDVQYEVTSTGIKPHSESVVKKELE